MSKKELQEKLKAIQKEMKVIADQTEPLSEEQEQRWDALDKDFEATEKALRRVEKLERNGDFLQSSPGRVTTASVHDQGNDYVSEADRARQVEITCEQAFATPAAFLQAVRAAANPENAGHDLLQRLANHNQVIQAATGHNEGVPSEGGYLVSPQMQSQIEQRVFTQDNVPGRCQRVNIGAGYNSFYYPMIDETSRADGSRRGGVQSAWTAEAGTLSSSQTQFKVGRLPLDKITVLTYATEELLEDVTALMSWYENEVPAEFDFKLTDGIINGTGAGMPQGILNSGALVTVSAEGGQGADTILSENVMKMYARHKNPSRAVWLINQNCWPQIFQFRLSSAAGEAPMFIPAGQISNAPFGTLFGRPIIPIEQCPTLGDVGDIILADLSSYLIIRKGGVKNASSIHVKFTTDERAFRWTMRVNGQTKYDTAVTPFKGTDTVSEFVALAGR